MRQTLTADFGGLHKNMNCAFTLKEAQLVLHDLNVHFFFNKYIYISKLFTKYLQHPLQGLLKMKSCKIPYLFIPLPIIPTLTLLTLIVVQARVERQNKIRV